MNESMTGMGWFPILFVILVIWLIFGGGFGMNANRGGWDHGCDRVSNCEVERQGIIDSAKTQYLIEQQGAATRAANQAGTEAIMAQNSRIYEQKLQETIFDLKAENQSLRNNIFTKEQTDGLAARLAECCCDFNRRLDGIECRMLTKPQLSGVAATCGGQLVPAGFGYGYGYGGTVIA